MWQHYWQGGREFRHALRHFVRHLPDTLAVFRNDGGIFTDKANSLVSTVRSDGSQAHPDDYHVGGALLLHLRRSLTIGSMLRDALGYRGATKFRTHLIDHHYAHAASAFFLSPFERAAIITWDGIGSDGTSTYLALGERGRIRDIRRVKFPHSLGALYACVTGYLGFRPTRDEGKVMGLAAYGEPTHVEAMRELVRLLPDGRYELDLSWFRHHATGKHQVSPKFLDRFGAARPHSRDAVPQHYADIAYGLQVTLEEAGLHVARWLQAETGETRLATASGVALNVAERRILLGPVHGFFAQPAAAMTDQHWGGSRGQRREVRRRPTGEYIFLRPPYSESEMEKGARRGGAELPARTDHRNHSPGAGRQQDHRMVPGPDGVRSAGPR
jgi:carbamoyltransferase